jgi:hypothetical protein
MFFSSLDQDYALSLMSQYNIDIDDVKSNLVDTCSIQDLFDINSTLSVIFTIASNNFTDKVSSFLSCNSYSDSSIIDNFELPIYINGLVSGFDSFLFSDFDFSDHSNKNILLFLHILADDNFDTDLIEFIVNYSLHEFGFHDDFTSSILSRSSLILDDHELNKKFTLILNDDFDSIDSCLITLSDFIGSSIDVTFSYGDDIPSSFTFNDLSPFANYYDLISSSVSTEPVC